MRQSAMRGARNRLLRCHNWTFSNMYCTISHELLTRMLKLLRFLERNVDLVRHLYDVNAAKIRIPPGDTAYIEQRRGMAQGDSLSCAMVNLCVGALVRFIQATPECSFAPSPGTDPRRLLVLLTLCHRQCFL